MILTLFIFSAVKSVPASSAVSKNSSRSPCSVTERIFTHDASFLSLVMYWVGVRTCPLALFRSTHLFTSLVVRSLDTTLEVSTAHVGALSLSKPVVHKTVAEANSLLGLCEHHLC